MKLPKLTRGLAREALSVSRRSLLSGLGALAIVAPASAGMYFPPGLGGSNSSPFDLGGAIGSYQGEIDPHLAPYFCKGDAVQGSNATVSGNTLSLNVYQFTSVDVGKALWCDAWGGARTINGLVNGNPNACTFNGTAVGGGTGRGFIFGTDDTAGFQAAIDAAQYNPTGAYVGDTTAGVGNRNFGRLVKQRSGRLYLISNSSASYNAGAGKIGALVMRKRTGIVGTGTASSGFVIAPGSYGFGIVNENATKTEQNVAFCDFMTAKGFAVCNCSGGYAGLTRVRRSVGFSV